VYDIHRYHAEVLISPEISDFPRGPTPSFLSFARASLFYYPSTPPTLRHRRRRHLRASPLYQTKQSRTRSDDDSPYVRLLGDNLYTQATYVITYSLDTSFSRARRRFSRLCTSAACYRERIALCDYSKQCASFTSLSKTPLEARESSLLSPLATGHLLRNLPN